MNAELIAIAALMAPGAFFGAVTLTGHALARRRDAALAAALAAGRAGGPKPPGDPQPAPEDVETKESLAAVVDLDRHRRPPPPTAHNIPNLPQEEAS
ncbi:hypothetical protein [Streptomyces sp. BA2]|uniref:hypothetical protein n=1 Tax=Streptomyces sp. BA2 TaxID=436595 RepID=UPI001324CD58|nr:hypothetical protein [Streptomyces sp. BA2]MWA10691.1 hypothetical protein [Streptomyces sp. BA2]